MVAEATAPAGRGRRPMLVCHRMHGRGGGGATARRWSIDAQTLAPVLLTLAVALAASPVFYPKLAPTDAYVYMAAGERLNAGHKLYRISPGDRVIGSNPPYWDVPTLSPPLLGVLWRPLAVLGPTGMLLGWALAGVAFLSALAVVAMRARYLALAAVAILMAPVGIQLGLGNVNGFLALGLVCAWLWRDRPALLGSVVALLAMIKVTPLVVILWMLATRRLRALAWFVVACVVLLAVSVLGAGWDAHVEYLGVITRTSSVGTSDLSLAGIARMIGVPPDAARLLPWLALLLGSAAIVYFRRQADIAFAVAVAMLVFGSPVVQAYWLALLVIALTPFGSSRERRAEVGPVVREQGTA